MTCITYKDGIIAYDSRITEGRTIVDDDCNKRSQVGKLNFFLCGDVAGEEALIRSYVTGLVTEEDAEKAANSMAWVVDRGNIYRLLTIGEDLLIEPQRLTNTAALGSGGPYALGAMDSGASAKEAVKIASGRDVSTGGKIRAFKVPASST